MVPSKPSNLVRHTQKIPLSVAPNNGRESPLPYLDDDDEDRGRSPVPEQEAPSRSPSRSPSIQPGEKRPRPEDSDSEIEEISVHKALKINETSGRPKARDYDDVAKEIILQAATIYRCLLGTNNGFPELAAETDLVKLAWDNANKESGMQSLELTPDIAKIVSPSLSNYVSPSTLTTLFHHDDVYQIKARGSQARGEAKDKTKLFVETMYGFESGRSKKAIAANRKLAEELKREKGFIYEVCLFFV